MTDMNLVFRQIYELAFLSVREAFRKRFVYSVMLISLLFLVIDFNCEKKYSQALEQYSFDLALTFFFISFWNMLIALIIPSAIIADEIENKTYTMILSRPVHRMTYIAGKAAGVMALLLANLLFILVTYSIMNLIKNDITVSALWISSSIMLLNYTALILLVIFMTLNLNRTAAILVSGSIISFSTFIDMNYLMLSSSNESIEMWRTVVYWVMPQFGSLFLYSTSLITKMEWNMDLGHYSIYQLSVWTGLLLLLLHVTFTRKELN